MIFGRSRIKIRLSDRPLLTAAALACVLMWGCSTEKNKFINRAYHNTNARFNGYFNAQETIKEALIDFHAQYKDDYTKTLPVFIIPDENTSKSLYPAMDRAIEKTSVVIKKHSMPDPEFQKNKKEEWCKWIDDNWLVMGQAHYYKRELHEAKTRFDYVTKYYGKLPIKYEGQLWLARTYMEMDDMSNALRFLDKLQTKMDEDAANAKEKKKATKRSKNSKFSNNTSEPAFPMYIADELAMTWADYYIRKKEYGKAIEYLLKAIELTRKKTDRARLCFILAQLYQLRGDNGSALFYYARVDKLNPEYEMEFYSRIFRALISEGGNTANLKKQLLKMSKDDKNKDYLDQIYYALADIELKADHRKEGIDYLNKSIAASSTNNRQKGLSYMRLGDLYYTEKNFIRSKAYYDSTMLNLPKEYENYKAVEKKADGLKDLVANLIIIQTEDSLQRIARMPREQMEKYLDDVITQRKEEEERKKQADLNKTNLANTGPLNVTGGSGKWYWWNPQSVQQGMAAFKKTWGTRKLEDNWRRSDKSSNLEYTDPETQDTLQIVNEDDPLAERENLIKTLPLGEEKLKASNERLALALFNAGVIYKDKLDEKKLSANTLKRFVKDFPDHEQALPAYYQLYRIYFDSDPALSKEYEKIILEKYPDSDYAKIIRNPNYLREEADKMKKDERTYEELFAKYKVKNYGPVIEGCTAVIASGSKSPVMPRFYFLKAFAHGNQLQYEEMEKTLAALVDKYPNDELGKQGLDLLEIVRNRNSINDARSGKSTYIYEPSEEHFFVLLFPNTLGSVNDAKNKISNFNQLSFSAANLKISNNFIDLDNQLILVKSMENKEKAMNYYVAFKNNADLKGLNDIATFFVITSKNYAAFYLEKKAENYLKFFEEKYK